MDKYLLKVADFAKYCGTTKDTLLWYDRIGLLHPAVVKENGYRFYHLSQQIQFDLITCLKDAGCPLADISVYLKNQNPQELLTLFIEREQAIAAEIAKLENSRLTLISRRRELCSNMTIPLNTPYITDLAPEAIATVPVHKGEGYFETDYDAAVQRLIMLARQDARIIRHQLGAVINLSSIVNHTLQEEQLFFRTTDNYDGEGRETKPGGMYLHISHEGNYDDSVYETLEKGLAYIKSHHLEVAGKVYQYDINIHFHPFSSKNHIHEFQIPVRRK